MSEKKPKVDAVLFSPVEEQGQVLIMWTEPDCVIVVTVNQMFMHKAAADILALRSDW